MDYFVTLFMSLAMIGGLAVLMLAVLTPAVALIVTLTSGLIQMVRRRRLEE